MQSNKTAIITGISGQDGAYLAKLLLGKGYKVVGLVRSYVQSNLKGLTLLGIKDRVILEECDLTDLSQLIKLLNVYMPDEVYNLAAQSSVSLSFKQPIGTFQFNTTSVYNLLEAIKLVKKDTRFFQASSSEMYGKVVSLPINEESVFHPVSPYAISKAAAHWTCVHYRESYSLYVCCGILFNHESFLRNNNFFVKKVISDSLAIQAGKLKGLSVGNIDVRRDFGYAPSYVEAIYLMLQQDAPEDLMICSGRSISLREIIEYVFDKLNISKDKYSIDPGLYRPAEIIDIYGDNTLAKKKLNWNYDFDFKQVLDKLIDEESALQVATIMP